MTITAKAYIEHENLALVPTLREIEDITIRVVHQATTDPESDTFPFVIECDDNEALENALDSDHTVTDYELIDNNSGIHIYYIGHADDTLLLSPALTSVNGFMLDAKTKDRGWLVQIQLPSREELHSVWEFAEERGIDCSLIEIHEKRSEGTDISFGLTDEQQEALEVAYKSGYFSEPREKSLSDIAEEIDVSSTAMGGRLRRGMRNLVSATLIDDEE
ncbi:helix-turn-helix domain-containing protein [Halomicrococcus sp. SG-WS-1]|uniref:helix-turn-helix domain-containing protein n=1 Tax=Halomicrococcus sp. SG-WS-1 TaxID=3439057 RepID=UPI003F7A33B9